MASGRISTDFNHRSGPIRGGSRLEPFSKPPCGIDCQRYRLPAYRTARDDLDEGLTHSEMRLAGYTALDLAVAGLRAIDLRDAGFSSQQIAGTRRFRAQDLRAAGCSVLDCLGAAMLSPADLVRGGYTAHELGTAGIGDAAIAALLSRVPSVRLPSARRRQQHPLTATEHERPRTAPVGRQEDLLEGSPAPPRAAMT